MPPLGWPTLSQLERPDDEDGWKQIWWSPASAAVKVKRPDWPPRWETTRWLLSKISCSCYY
jgi:hypothetical protein